MATARSRWVPTKPRGRAANDPRLLVGLGAETPATARVRVQWPDGTSAEWPAVATDRWTTLTQGQATVSGTGASR